MKMPLGCLLRRVWQVEFREGQLVGWLVGWLGGGKLVGTLDIGFQLVTDLDKVRLVTYLAWLFRWSFQYSCLVVCTRLISWLDFFIKRLVVWFGYVAVG